MGAPPSAASPTGEGDDMPPGSLPADVRVLQQRLTDAFRAGKGVRKAFDEFCAFAFSKPEWVGASSEFLADLFEHDEEQLSTLVRVPDMIIELSEGCSAVTYMVASRWAIRGEVEHLNRLAEAMLAAHSRLTSEAVVELALALCTSLAIIKHARAEDLMAMARPGVTDDQRESLADAELWLAAGKIVRTATSEERRMWDERLRKPRVAWPWESKEELAALRHLLDHIGVGVEGTRLFRAVVPPSWWQLAMEMARQRDDRAAASPEVSAEPPHALATPVIRSEEPRGPAASRPPRGEGLRMFWGGWILGALTASFLVLWVGWNPGKPEAKTSSWREEQLKDYERELFDLAEEKAKVHAGTWEDSSRLLMGNSATLPPQGSRYRLFLEWLQLDPPKDSRTQAMVSRLLYENFPDHALVDLWEKLSAEEGLDHSILRQAAEDALRAPGVPWSDRDRERLRRLAEG